MSRFALAVVPFLALAACVAPAADPPATSGASEALTAGIDIPKSEALLAKAVKLADLHAAGNACESEAYLSSIVDLLRQAIAVRDTVYFRTQVIAKKPVLAHELKGTLAWQEVLGNFKPNDLNTLPAALSADVSLWDTDGGAFGNKQRLEFLPDGKAILHVLDVNSSDFHWNDTPTTWTYEKGQLSLGTGDRYVITFESGTLEAQLPGGGIAFVSTQSECEA
jgi:hypothetical protein